MGDQPHQLRLDLGEQALWHRLPQETRSQCVALLSLLLREVWQAEKNQQEDCDEGKDHPAAP
jgi:hypothetical protein